MMQPMPRQAVLEVRHLMTATVLFRTYGTATNGEKHRSLTPSRLPLGLRPQGGSRMASQATSAGLDLAANGTVAIRS